MSWFPDEIEACRVPVSPARITPAGHELAPGVSVERSGVFALPRRGFLGLAGAAAALVAAGGALRAQDPKAQDPSTQDPRAQDPQRADPLGSITFEQFVSQAERLAKELIASKQPNEDAYLLHLASLLCRLDAKPGFESNEERQVEFRNAHRGERFAVMQIKLAEGAALPFHDHYEYNGLILALEGTIHARNFEMVGDELRPADDQDFLIRETVRATLTPGRISTLARRRDNIHDLRAGKGGGRVLDIFTFFADDAGSKYLTVEDEPVDAEQQIYRAKWPPRRKRD